MKIEDFKIAKEIEYDREKLRTAIAELQRPHITVEVHSTNGLGGYLFATIGMEEACEHPDTNAAAFLINSMIARRQKELDKLSAEFDAL